MCVYNVKFVYRRSARFPEISTKNLNKQKTTHLHQPILISDIFFFSSWIYMAHRREDVEYRIKGDMLLQAVHHSPSHTNVIIIVIIALRVDQRTHAPNASMLTLKHYHV